MPVLVAARVDQDGAGDRADAARERDLRRGDGARARPDPPGHEGERGRRALWQGFVHGQGTGWEGKVELAFALLAGLVRPRDQDVHRDRRPAGGRGRADAVRDLGLRRRLLGRPHEAALSRRAARRTTRTLEDGLLAVYDRAIDHCEPGASFAELDVLVRDGIAEIGYPGPAVAPDLPRHRRARPRAAVCAPGGRRRRSRRAWCSRSSPAATGRAAAGCASRTTS